MKIVQALGWYYPEHLGGTEAYVAGLARRLKAAGHQVLIAAPTTKPANRPIYEHEGIPVFRYPLSPHPTREEAQGRVPARGSDRLHAWLAAERPDIFHLHTLQVGLGLRELEAAATAGARLVATNHLGGIGYLCQRGTMMRWGEKLCDGLAKPGKCAACELQHRGLRKPIARLVGRIPSFAAAGLRHLPGRLGSALGMRSLIRHNLRTQARIMERLDRFVLLTEWARDAALANGAPAEKLALNRLGYSQEIAVRKPSPDDFPTTHPLRVGYLGRFAPVKGIEVLAQALARLPRRLPITVELRGPIKSDSERAVLARVQEWAGSDPRLQVHPPVSASDVPEILAGLDLLCCPSIGFENGPTVAIEAHAVGTPVIGSRIGGLAEMVDDGVNGRLLEPGDAKGLAKVLRRCIRKPSIIDAWRRSLPPARSMDDIAQEYLADYATLTAAPKPIGLALPLLAEKGSQET